MHLFCELSSGQSIRRHYMNGVFNSQDAITCKSYGYIFVLADEVSAKYSD